MDKDWPGNNIDQANGRAADAPGADDEDDFGEFGGFEAADPIPPNVAEPGHQAEAGSSPWAVFASGSGTFRQPDLLCAQNSFPQYLDPSGISGGPTNTASVNPAQDVQPSFPANLDLSDHDQITDAADQARIAENVLDGTLNASTRSVTSPEAAQPPSSPAPLPDLGLGGNRLPLMREASPDLPPGGAAAEVELQPAPQDDVAPEQVEPAAEVNENVAPPIRVEEDVQPMMEENAKLKKDLEDLSALNQQLEEDLIRVRTDLEQQQARLTEIQERHSRELEEVEKAGHDALGVVVEQYKESSRAAVLEQQEVSLQHLQEALKNQAVCYQQIMETQASDLRHQHEADLKSEEERSRDMMEAARIQQQEQFQAFLKEEQDKQTAEIHTAIQTERDSSKRLMEAAMTEEQEKAARTLKKEQEKFADVARDVKERCSQDVKVVIDEERTRQQMLLSTAMEEERERGRESVRDTQKASREEIQSYIQEQRQNDSILRRRHLASLDLFLASARQQLQMLMETENNHRGTPRAVQDNHHHLPRAVQDNHHHLPRAEQEDNSRRTSRAEQEDNSRRTSQAEQEEESS
ncbi:coiled-coil domain-containing protein 91-like [Haliotis rufescens]|uniref:coiled-coil domain-containing protein 91-like n=1 Tax=Haliotis rufescens TaxID=6454 RepID=UPI00201F7D54|nr:coiled-coil domain-containing protein 91-like [Haliotis rufescens]